MKWTLLATWLDDAEQSEWAGLEEPFAILHKVTLHTIREERDKDAAARKTTYRVRRTAAQLYQKVASMFEVPVADGARAVTTAEEDDLTLILFLA